MSRVPKIIWQTYKSIEQLPEESLPCMDSWLQMNPEWAYHFCSDSDIEEFFHSFRGGEFMELYRAMPMPVMKADLWRYAALFEFGGFYADIDTTCRAPLQDWLNERVGFHVACETDHTYLCQWAFASAPGHPALDRVLKLIRERVEHDGGVNESMDHYVHYYTGPAVWSEGIMDYLNVRTSPNELQERKVGRSKDMVIYPSGHFGGAKITHANGSIFWCDLPGYSSWQRQRKDYANRVV